jgi:hypothetical protein
VSRACAYCGRDFAPPPGSQRRTCSEPCAKRLVWREMLPEIFALQRLPSRERAAARRRREEQR